MLFISLKGKIATGFHSGKLTFLKVWWNSMRQKLFPFANFLWIQSLITSLLPIMYWYYFHNRNCNPTADIYGNTFCQKSLNYQSSWTWIPKIFMVLKANIWQYFPSRCNIWLNLFCKYLLSHHHSYNWSTKHIFQKSAFEKFWVSFDKRNKLFIFLEKHFWQLWSLKIMKHIIQFLS